MDRARASDLAQRPESAVLSLPAEEVVQRLCRLAELGRCQVIGYDARRSGRRDASRYGRSSAVAAGLDESHSECIEGMKDNGGELSIKSQLNGDAQLLISVTDAGVGLPGEDVDKIFNAFFTTPKAQVWD